ncbi:hypothetical protein C8Q70DRAFT_1047143 [Cubamyces menziesii]|nr:hypothetical protein C8Q70DRAFT_1047143 [Cubamyces menziesii]
MVKRSKDRTVRFRFSDDEADDNGDVVRSISHTQRHVDYNYETRRTASRTSYLSVQEIVSSQPQPDSTSFTSTSEPDSTLSGTSYNVDPSDLLGFLDVEMDENDRPHKTKERPLLRWMAELRIYLAELLRLEGRGSFTSGICPFCSVGEAAYRCEDCFETVLYCASCMVTRHHSNPLHRILVWQDQFFHKTTLKALGLRIQLGHAPGEVCCNAKPAFGDDFVVLDVSGIHEVAVDFCNCEQVQTHVVQVLGARWYPATSHEPKTAATFRLLEDFHILSTQSKISGHEFYISLSRRTDNTGVLPPKDRYQAFMAMARQWRHLAMLKRSGCGHSDGTAADVPGECAVECPACPHPGRNLPDDWEDAPKSRSWLYKLFVSLDANFRLKRKKVSNDINDPSLNRGRAFVVDESAYKEHLAAWGHLPTEKHPHCNNHNAVKFANAKDCSHLAATGVGTVDCARHGMKRLCSVGDLQKGERYVNMDYLLHSSLSRTTLPSITVTYDIACQYSINLRRRFGLYGYDTLAMRTVQWGVPKFHIAAHQEICRSAYSLHYLPECGSLDGEGVERGWALANLAAPSTKEMGPGSRHDMLDDIFADQNWYKVTKLPASLLDRIKIAVRERSTHVAAYEEYSQALPADQLAAWKKSVEAWEADSTQPNPFSTTKSHVTQATVRLQLSQEDSAALQSGAAAVLHEDFSSSTMITAGLDLEDQQRRLAQDTKLLHAHATDLSRAHLLERQNILHRKILAWIEIQRIFMPAVSAIRARLADNALTTSSPCDIPLLLPGSACLYIPCSEELLRKEWALREAQAHDALSDIRSRLEVRYHLYHVKDRFIRGQRPNTRMNTCINLLQQKLDTDAARYRAAYAALCSLSPYLKKETSNWHKALNPLQDSDLRHLAEDESASFSESRRSLSWIWTTTPLSVKECTLLQEEMRRVAAYHRWASDTWLNRIGSIEGRADYIEGADAYARRQSALRLSMKAFCEHTWRFVQQWVELGCEQYPDPSSEYINEDADGQMVP